MNKGEALLLHLSKYHITKTEKFIFGKREMTQEGIAEALGIKRKNVPRVLKKLEEQGYIEGYKAIVNGIKWKRKVYVLTEKGKRYVRNLREEGAYNEAE